MDAQQFRPEADYFFSGNNSIMKMRKFKTISRGEGKVN